MRKFYQTWPIFQTPSAKSDPVTDALKQSEIGQTLSVISAEQARLVFPLPWSHYVRLMSVKKKAGRTFYESEAVRGGWSIRQLERQINSLLLPSYSTLSFDREALHQTIGEFCVGGSLFKMPLSSGDQLPTRHSNAGNSGRANDRQGFSTFPNNPRRSSSCD